MKNFLKTMANMCDCTIWLLVILFEIAYFYVAFTNPGLICGVAEFFWPLATVPILLPIAALATLGEPFVTTQES